MLMTSKHAVASAGDAKRKQSARPPMGRRRVRPCLKNPAGGSCPGSASRAEASTFRTFFVTICLPRIFSPEIPPRASPRHTPGTPKPHEFRLFASKVVPGTPGSSFFWTISAVSYFSFDFWSIFRRKSMKKNRQLFQSCACFFSLGDP